VIAWEPVRTLTRRASSNNASCRSAATPATHSSAHVRLCRRNPPGIGRPPAAETCLCAGIFRNGANRDRTGDLLLAKGAALAAGSPPKGVDLQRSRGSAKAPSAARMWIKADYQRFRHLRRRVPRLPHGDSRRSSAGRCGSRANLGSQLCRTASSPGTSMPPEYTARTCLELAKDLHAKHAMPTKAKRL
jgi:hypothetical protein